MSKCPAGGLMMPFMTSTRVYDKGSVSTLISLYHNHISSHVYDKGSVSTLISLYHNHISSMAYCVTLIKHHFGTFD